MTPFKIQYINEEKRGDDFEGVNEIDLIKDKNVKLEKTNQGLLSENSALKTQIESLTNNILNQIQKTKQNYKREDRDGNNNSEQFNKSKHD